MGFITEIREQYAALQPKAKDYRNLGLVFLAAFCVLAGLAWWRDSGAWPWLLGVGAVFGLWGLFWPWGLKPVYSVWMLLALSMGYVVSRVILMIVFYLVVTPIGLVMRLFGKDVLDLKMGDRESYWVERERGGHDPVSTEKMY